MEILVCGGAGYIGAHMVKMLAEHGHHPVTFDNLSTGNRKAVQWGTLAEGELLSPADLAAIFGRHDFAAVMHFSARALVGESVADPALYYANNVGGTLNLLEQMRLSGVRRFIFSSTAAVFGNPVRLPIDEEHPKFPINPYGRSKLMVEHILEDYAPAYDISSVTLRYFNAAGADPSGLAGESHNPETHLIPNILHSLLGAGEPVKVFGDDYSTPDGTCVRDYVHINDLCQAHLRALEYLEARDGAYSFNLGNGNGFTIREVLAAAERVTGRKVPFEIAARRPGDPAVLVADSARARSELGWSPQFPTLDAMIETAWRWHQAPRY